jgi:peptidyl-prolyl cis-trans isomerase C
VKKTTTISMTLAFVATMAMAQSKPAVTPAAAATSKPAATAAAGDPVIISAGDCSIKQSEFESALKSLPPEYQQYAQGPGKKQFADDFLRMKMLAAEGMKNGLDKDADVQKQLSLMKENLVANAQLQKIDKSIKLTDEEVKKIYDTNLKDYEQVKASHILIAFKGSPAAQKDKPELTEEQAKAKAEDLRTKIAGGADFAETAKKESDDTGSGARGGELGSFGHGQMVPEFETAAFSAKPGDVTPVVRTQFGYHIIKVEAHDYTPFESVKSAIEKKEHQKRLQDALDAMKDKIKPTYNEAYFAAPAAEAKPAIPPDVQTPKPASKP